MTVIEERLQQLDKLTLDRGKHKSFEDGHCALELVSWLANEPFSDVPKCVSPVIRTFVVNWNDSLRSNEERDRLIKPLLAGMVGTRTKKKDEETRAWMAADWMVREQAPAWLRLAGLTEHAHALENLAALTGGAAAVKAQPTLDAARKAADATRAAAWNAAQDAARAAAQDAARNAARAALEPTVTTLQPSAALLVKRMCDVGRA